MKLNFSILFVVLSLILYSCAEINTFEVVYEPKDLKLKSYHKKSENAEYNINFTQDAFFEYDNDGILLKEILIQKSNNLLQTSTKIYYYDSKKRIDSVIINTKLENYNNTTPTNLNYVDIYKYDNNDFIEKIETYVDNSKQNLLSRSNYFYTGEYCNKIVVFYNYDEPNSHTDVTEISFDKNGNRIGLDGLLYTFDDKNNPFKNVYIPSLKRILLITSNNQLHHKYNVYGDFEKYKYKYNIDMFPDSYSVFDSNINDTVQWAEFKYY